MKYQEVYRAVNGEQLKKEASVKTLASIIGMRKKAADTPKDINKLRQELERVGFIGSIPGQMYPPFNYLPDPIDYSPIGKKRGEKPSQKVVINMLRMPIGKLKRMTAGEKFNPKYYSQSGWQAAKNRWYYQPYGRDDQWNLQPDTLSRIWKHISDQFK